MTHRHIIDDDENRSRRGPVEYDATQYEAPTTVTFEEPELPNPGCAWFVWSGSWQHCGKAGAAPVIRSSTAIPAALYLCRAHATILGREYISPGRHAITTDALWAARDELDALRRELDPAPSVATFEEPSWKDQAQVYVGVRGDQAKIGASIDPRRRAQDLNIELLAVVDGGPVREGEFHTLWEHQRIRGEWFEATDDLVEWANSLALNAPVRAEAAT